VRAQLQALQIRFDGKRFAAHVTLLRDLPAGLPTIAPGAGVASTEAGRSIAASQAVESIDPFAWPIQAAQLLVSERDAAGATGYRPLDP
jgi:2'-5' RNA ligase